MAMNTHDKFVSKYSTLAVYFENSYLTNFEYEFVESVKKELDDYDNRTHPTSELTSALIFPPFSSRLRFIAHKTVEECYPDLHTVSIGTDERRRLVVYKMNPGNTTKINQTMETNKSVTEKNEVSCHNKQSRVKNRRPDMQLYIPRAKRRNDVEIAPQNLSTEASETVKKENIKSKRKTQQLEKELVLNDTFVPNDVTVELKSTEVNTNQDPAGCTKSMQQNIPSKDLLEKHELLQTPEQESLSKEVEIDYKESTEKSDSNLNLSAQTCGCVNLIENSFTSDCNLETIENISEDACANSVKSESECTIQSESCDNSNDESSWEALYSEDGDCLMPDLIQELTNTLGEVEIEKPKIDYTRFTPKIIKDHEYDHIIEIYDFPVEYKTQDLVLAFAAFRDRGFDIKWVDDTHALGLFSSPMTAAEALAMCHPMMKTRRLGEATRESQLKARRYGELLQPYKPRPETSATLARRLVTGALGLPVKISREQREMEKQKLKDAKAKKKLTAKQKNDVWEGTVN